MLPSCVAPMAKSGRPSPLTSPTPATVPPYTSSRVAAVKAGNSGLPLAPEHRDLLIVPASFSTVFTGFLLLVARFKAITQAIGYLVLENGIFIFGLLLLEAMPFLVEIGVLLDLFVGIFVVSIIIHHINREFASLDTRRLASLKE